MRGDQRTVVEEVEWGLAEFDRAPSTSVKDMIRVRLLQLAWDDQIPEALQDKIFTAIAADDLKHFDF